MSDLPEWVLKASSLDNLRLRQALSIAWEALNLCTYATSLPPVGLSEEFFHHDQFLKSIGTCARAMRRIESIGDSQPKELGK